MNFADEKQSYEKIVNLLKRKDDKITWGHCERVGKVAAQLAEIMGKTDEECMIVRRAGELHDAGKIKTRDMILSKPGKLTEEEFIEMKNHVNDGVTILKSVGLDRPEYLEAAGNHHAWYDEQKGGYKANNIKSKPSELSEIMAIADVYDAMANKRSYKSACTTEMIKEELEKQSSNGHFNPKISKIFMDELFYDLERERNSTPIKESIEKIEKSKRENTDAVLRDTLITQKVGIPMPDFL